jgi:ATP-dependent helicase/DNAse subunit B
MKSLLRLFTLVNILEKIGIKPKEDKLDVLANNTSTDAWIAAHRTVIDGNDTYSPEDVFYGGSAESNIDASEGTNDK